MLQLETVSATTKFLPDGNLVQFNIILISITVPERRIEKYINTIILSAREDRYQLEIEGIYTGRIYKDIYRKRIRVKKHKIADVQYVMASLGGKEIVWSLSAPRSR